MALSRRTRSLVAALAAIGVIALTVSLGNWQRGRAAEKAALQQEIDRAATAVPVDVGAMPVDGVALDGRRIAAAGSFEPERSIFIDNRTHQGVAGFHVVTPLRVDGGNRRLLVLRGWIARDPGDRNRLPMLRTPAGTVRVEGIAVHRLPQALQLGDDPVPGPSERIWQRFDVPKFERWSGEPAQDLVMRQTAALDDGLVRDWPVPGSDVDKHRAYAFQWYAMALATALFWGWAAWRARRPGTVR